MLTKKTVLAICCAVAIGIGGCSRQQSDWQRTREANSTDAYELFLKKYPSGEFTAQAQARLKEMYEERDWQKARDADTPEAYQAFLKQYPEGKWTEEARIRVENFTLAQTPAGGGSSGGTPNAAARGETTPSTAAPSGASPNGTMPSAATPSRATSGGAAARGEESEAAKPTASAKGGSGKYAVQLGAYKSGQGAAKKRWEHLQKEYPKLLAGLTSKVVPRKSGGGTLYRLQAVGLSEAHAGKICKVLRAKSQPCVIVRPPHG